MVDYIIIQAGGKGTRLKELTANKPKGIVPVNNLPMIFHLFKKYPEKKFIIIGDYKYEILEKYLEIFAKVDHLCVKANGIGTCGGLKQAIEYIPEGERFLLIWSDLVVGESFYLKNSDENQIGLPENFECRWKYENGEFAEEKSIQYGVAGFFVFKNKKEIIDVPESGEFVKWLQSKKMKFEPILLNDVKEVGTLIAYEQTKKEYVCRPFNKMEIKGDKIIKIPVNEQGTNISIKEKNWYKEITNMGYKRIPQIYQYEPLTMQLIDGKNPFQSILNEKQKEKVVINYINALKELHLLGEKSVDYFSIKENYYTKTFDRISMIRDMVPFANEEYIVINGVKCLNVFFAKEKVKRLIEKYLYETEFTVIHGDCTFSNVIVDKNMNITLIDPRGYFGKTLIYGDVLYDWAKVYYSIYGNYDQFNNKKFKLAINESNIELLIESNGYEKFVPLFLELTGANKAKLDLIHSIIWMSLSTYAWEDYDSICGAFYNGLYYFNQFMEENENGKLL